MNRFRQFAYKVSKNHTRTAWVLKCDIKKFFASIDQDILLGIVGRYIPDSRINNLLAEVVGSFRTSGIQDSHMTLYYPTGKYNVIRVGLPLGNLTSQLLVNVYMNEFDQYVKHTLKAQYYIRYADDFVLLSHDKEWLLSICRYIGIFLRDRLNLQLHPNKVSITTFASGVDFLGWVHFPDHRVLRTATKHRMLRRLEERRGQEGEDVTRASYLGLLSHGNAGKLSNWINQ